MSDLATLGIPYAAREHAAVFTVAESRMLGGDFPGEHTKNLFLKDTGGMFWLVTVPAEARVDLKALPAAIGSKRVSFARAEDMIRLLGIEPGSVTPLAMINAAPGSVSAAIDAGLAVAARVNVHPLRNTGTLGIAGRDIVRLVQHWGHDMTIAKVPALQS